MYPKLDAAYETAANMMGCEVDQLPEALCTQLGSMLYAMHRINQFQRVNLDVVALVVGPYLHTQRQERLAAAAPKPEPKVEPEPEAPKPAGRRGRRKSVSSTNVAKG